VKLENLESVDQKRQRIIDFIGEHTEIFSRRGAVVEKWREYAGRRQGPVLQLDLPARRQAAVALPGVRPAVG